MTPLTFRTKPCAYFPKTLGPPTTSPTHIFHGLTGPSAVYATSYCALHVQSSRKLNSPIRTGPTSSVCFSPPSTRLPSCNVATSRQSLRSPDSPYPADHNFLPSAKQHIVTAYEAQIESTMNISSLSSLMDGLHPKIKHSVQESRKHQRETHAKGNLANFVEFDLVFVARDEFFEGEQLCLRW